MKRNELFKSLMNVQSQVTSLMNVVLQEADGNVGETILKYIVPEEIQTIYKVTRPEAEKIAEQTKAVINSEQPEILDLAGKADPKLTMKIVEMSNRLGGDIHNEDFRTECKYVGVAAIALGCIFGYMLFPSIKSNLIAAFNSGSPDFERLGSLMKSLMSSALVVGLITLGGFLAYHGFKGIESPKHPVLKSILEALNNISKSIKRSFRSPIVPANKSWAW